MNIKNYSVACIIPAYNEEISIYATIESVHNAIPEAAIYVINNSSTDKTHECASRALKELNCKGSVLFEGRKGKGNAVRTAFQRIQADYYIIIDGDFTYDTSKIKNMLEKLIIEDADMIVGNRHFEDNYSKANTRLFHSLGNKLVISMINILFKAELKDIMSGMRIFKKRFIKLYPVLSNNFEIEVEMTLHALNHGFKVIEEPVKYRERMEGSSSKLNTYIDGMKVIKTILWIFKDYRPLSFFTILSIFLMLIALIFGYIVTIEYFLTGSITRIPLTILSSGLALTSIVFFAIGLILHSISKYHRLLFELEKNKVFRSEYFGEE